MAIYNESESLHAEYRLFTGAYLVADTLTGNVFEDRLIGYATGVTGYLASWTDPDTNIATGFVEITDRAHWNGQFTSRLDGSSIVWSAELQGQDYHEQVLGLGIPVVCWRRFHTKPNDWNTIQTAVGEWSAWSIAFVGQFVRNENEDDYRHGQTWRRTVEGISYNLTRKNATRFTVGPLNVVQGASVDVLDNDTLTNPAIERDQGEFVGTIADVTPTNIVDGKPQTVWISSSQPNITDIQGDYMPVGVPNGGVFISEVFFWPIFPYSSASCWWVEVYNTDDTDQKIDYLYFGSIAADGATFTETALKVYGGPGPIGAETRSMLNPGRFGIICGNRAIFERYTGGAPGAQWILDASDLEGGELIVPDPVSGYVSSGGMDNTFIWRPGGLPYYSNGTAEWYGKPPEGTPGYPGPHYGTFDSNLLPEGSGYSLARKLMAYDGASGKWIPYGGFGSIGAQYFERLLYPTPAAQSLRQHSVALKITLPENIAHITQTIDASTTTIPIDNVIGFTTGSQAIINAAIFNITERDGNDLIGAWETGEEPGAPIESGTRIYPYGEFDLNDSVQKAAMTGYPLSSVSWQRRKFPVPINWQMWVSYLDTARHYQEGGWDTDYYKPGNGISDSSGGSKSYTWHLTNNSEQFAWVRIILLVIDRMSDNGRAKMNEVFAKLGQLYVDSSGNTVEIDFTHAYDLIYYLLVTYYGMSESDLVDDSNVLLHQLGNFAIAIQPLYQILNDIARKTGCLIYYAPTGKIHIIDDPRWPLCTSTTSYYFTANNMRETLSWQDELPTYDWLILNATALSNDYPTPIRAVYPPPSYPSTEPPSGAIVKEVDGYSVTGEQEAKYLAEGIWKQDRYNGSLRLTPIAAMPDLYAGQIVEITYDFYGDDSTITRRYQIEQLSEQRGGTTKDITLSYPMQLRRFLDK